MHPSNEAWEWRKANTGIIFPPLQEGRDRLCTAQGFNSGLKHLSHHSRRHLQKGNKVNEQCEKNRVHLFHFLFSQTQAHPTEQAGPSFTQSTGRFLLLSISHFPQPFTVLRESHLPSLSMDCAPTAGAHKAKEHFLKSRWLCSSRIRGRRHGGCSKQHLSLKATMQKRYFRGIVVLFQHWLLVFESLEGHCSLLSREFWRDDGKLRKKKKKELKEQEKQQQLTLWLSMAHHFCVDPQIKSFPLLHCENMGKDQVVSYSQDSPIIDTLAASLFLFFCTFIIIPSTCSLRDKSLSASELLV